MYNPLELAAEIETKVSKDAVRKYYRLIRRDRWYGGICTSDCLGCNLRCLFCWSQMSRVNPEKHGDFYSSQEVARALTQCAKRHKVRQVRISGNEPTIAKEHLIQVLWLMATTPSTFILETNGILIDSSYAKALAQFKNLEVRVSIKGTTPQEFSLLTGADSQFFQRQIDSLTNLLEAGGKCHPSVMLSFSPGENIKKLKISLKQIHPSLMENFEEEYVFLYPHVKKRLKKANLVPLTAYSPGGIPEELV